MSADDLLAQLATLGVPESALTLRMIRSSGPGGQHVNKVATAIQLACDLTQCRLSDATRARLATLAGKRLSNEGQLTLTAQRLRTQEQNKRDALERLLALHEAARIVPKVRRPTKPTKASKQRRLDSKQQRGRHKALRGRVQQDD